MRKSAIKVLKEGESVIYESLNLSDKLRRGFVHELKSKFKDIRCECIVVATSYELCVSRYGADYKEYMEKTILKQMSSFKCPWYDEGWDAIKVIPGTSWADNHYYLSQYECRAAVMDHQTPHHKDTTIAEHCHRVEMYLSKHFDDYQSCLKKLGIYHDIGKVLTQTFDEKGVAHYYSHDCVSSYCVLLRQGETYLSDYILEQSVVIGYHMKKYHYRGNDEGYEKWHESLDKELKYKYDCLLAADKSDRD